MKQFSYQPKGVCSSLFEFEIDDHNKVIRFQATRGCNGNLKGIGQLLVGMDIDEVINRLENVTCGMKNTSCPDQIAKALKEFKSQC